eukprot:1181098-Rhodomonas_salina.1
MYAVLGVQYGPGYLGRSLHRSTAAVISLANFIFLGRNSYPANFAGTQYPSAWSPASVVGQDWLGLRPRLSSRRCCASSSRPISARSLSSCSPPASTQRNARSVPAIMVARPAKLHAGPPWFQASVPFPRCLRRVCVRCRPEILPASASLEHQLEPRDARPAVPARALWPAVLAPRRPGASSPLLSAPCSPGPAAACPLPPCPRRLAATDTPPHPRRQRSRSARASPALLHPAHALRQSRLPRQTQRASQACCGRAQARLHPTETEAAAHCHRDVLPRASNA